MADAVTVFSIAGIIIAIGFLANVLFKKTGFSDTLFLILIGIILGPVFSVFSREELLPITPFLTALTLMIILFDAGLNMEIYKVISQSFRATILSVMYVLAATAFVSMFAFFILNFTWLEALMLGPMTAGTSSVVIIPLISKLSVNENVKITLSLESTITDVLNIVIVLTLLKVYLGDSTSFQVMASTIVARFAVGVLIGFFVGIIWVKIMDIVKRQEYTYMLTISALILSYVGSELLGGSGSLTALLFGLTLGNYQEIYKTLRRKTDLSYMQETTKIVKHFQGEISFLMHAFFFVFLGVVYLPDWSGMLFAGIIIAVNIVFRYAAVTISTYKTDMYRYRKLVTLMCGTGLANATLSIMVYNTLTTQPTPAPHAYLYPLIVANIIIINNIITSIAPVLLKLKKKK